MTRSTADADGASLLLPSLHVPCGESLPAPRRNSPPRLPGASKSRGVVRPPASTRRGVTRPSHFPDAYTRRVVALSPKHIGHGGLNSLFYDVARLSRRRSARGSFDDRGGGDPPLDDVALWMRSTESPAQRGTLWQGARGSLDCRDGGGEDDRPLDNVALWLSWGDRPLDNAAL